MRTTFDIESIRSGMVSTTASLKVLRSFSDIAVTWPLQILAEHTTHSSDLEDKTCLHIFLNEQRSQNVHSCRLSCETIVF